MYQDKLYGDAARGCHHRGDGPDARQRPISHNRQRREHPVIGVSRRDPWGCIGGACRTSHRSRLIKRSRSPNQWNLGSTSLGEGGKPSWLLRRRPRRSRLPRRRPRRRSNNFFNRFVIVSDAPGFCGAPAFFLPPHLWGAIKKPFPGRACARGAARSAVTEGGVGKSRSS